MHERPIGELVDLLAPLGAQIRFEKKAGYPPVVVSGRGLAGGATRFPAANSSQYLSAALMVAPYADEEVVIELDRGQTSWPYAAMTAALMKEFGCRAVVAQDPETGEPTGIRVVAGVYEGRKYEVEPDASNATYFLAAAAVRPGAEITVRGLGRPSLQGDVGFAEVLQRMGAEVVCGDDSIMVRGPQQLAGLDIDMVTMPDAAMTLAATALFAEGPTTIRGLHTLRVKETDRLAALKAELEKLGADAEIGADTISIGPPDTIRTAEIETYADHRMAMSFAVVGTCAPGVTILDPGCVSKTYPAFFDDLERLRP
jgi:3-phosphoshikimate 1-carboxyvinyltransferase